MLHTSIFANGQQILSFSYCLHYFASVSWQLKNSTWKGLYWLQWSQLGTPNVLVNSEGFNILRWNIVDIFHSVYYVWITVPLSSNMGTRAISDWATRPKFWRTNIFYTIFITDWYVLLKYCVLSNSHLEHMLCCHINSQEISAMTAASVKNLDLLNNSMN